MAQLVGFFEAKNAVGGRGSLSKVIIIEYINNYKTNK